MKLFSPLAILAASFLCSPTARAQMYPLYPPGSAVAPPVTYAWNAPVLRSMFDANPLDDGYVYPFGYGEYAVYGRWAVGANCYILRRKMPTVYGYRWRAIRRCD